MFDIAALSASFGGFIWMIFFFVIALSVIVAVHEYGHYIVGRWCGIHAEVFSVGFGTVLLSRVDRHGTRWQFAALPFGGFVRFKGDASAASAPDALLLPKLWQKQSVRRAGGAGIAFETHKPAKRQRCKLPSRAMPVHTRKQHRAKSHRKNLRMNAAPSPDDIMAIFMHRDNDRKGDDKKEDHPYKPAKGGRECGDIKH